MTPRGLALVGLDKHVDSCGPRASAWRAQKKAAQQDDARPNAISGRGEAEPPGSAGRNGWTDQALQFIDSLGMTIDSGKRRRPPGLSLLNRGLALRQARAAQAPACQ
jgi:hypothetical protein